MSKAIISITVNTLMDEAATRQAVHNMEGATRGLYERIGKVTDLRSVVDPSSDGIGVWDREGNSVNNVYADTAELVEDDDSEPESISSPSRDDELTALLANLTMES